MSNPSKLEDRPKVVLKGIKVKAVGTGGGSQDYEITLTFEPGEGERSPDPGVINDAHIIFMVNRPVSSPYPCSILSGLQPTGTGNTRIYTLNTDFAFPKPSEVNAVIFDIDASVGKIDNSIAGSEYELIQA